MVLEYMDCTAWYWSTWTVLHDTGVHGLYCMILEYMDCTAWYWSTWTVLHGTGVHGLYWRAVSYVHSSVSIVASCRCLRMLFVAQYTLMSLPVLLSLLCSIWCTDTFESDPVDKSGKPPC